MDTVSINQLRTIIPGIQCDGTERIAVRKINEVMQLTIEPEKKSVTQLYVTVSENKFTIEVNFFEENATVQIFGLYQLNDKQRVEIKTQMNHFTSHCLSEKIWRGVLYDQSRAVFEGKIVVYSGAQKTDARLSNKNLLLSALAEVNTKPELEIYADDVKCSHGATVGCLDENALFYLRARGVCEQEAREMLIEAFVSESYPLCDIRYLDQKRGSTFSNTDNG